MGGGVLGGAVGRSGDGGAGLEGQGGGKVVERGLVTPRVVYSACVGKGMLLELGKGGEGGELERVVAGFVETLAG